MKRIVQSFAPLFLLSFVGAFGCESLPETNPGLVPGECGGADDPECVASGQQAATAPDVRDESLASVTTDALQALSSARNTDEALLALSRTLPNLGGLYLDEEGATNVLLTDHATEGEQITARSIGDAIAKQRPSPLRQGAQLAPTKIARAKYRFSELKQLRDRAKDVLAVDGVLSLDANERTNRVTVGVASEAVAGRARAWWAKQGLPLEALEVPVEEPFEPLWTLNSYIRPTPGGYAIQNNNGSTCTLGYPVYSYAMGMWGFITNSHCTNTQGGVESTNFAQGGEFLATEYLDPNYETSAHFSYPNCPSGQVCRRSDAAFAGLPYPGYHSGAFGKIANTIDYCFLPDTSCSTTVNSSSPTNTPRTFAPSPLVGQHFEKIGRTTGWTYGPINQTCADFNQNGSNRTILCEYTVDAGVAPGDSGSPVFTWDGTNNPIGGILWGGWSSNARFVFSDYIGISDELGPLAYY